jgi:hypothetical protein
MRPSICRNKGRVKYLSAICSGEVPGLSDQPPGRLEQPLLEAREKPGLDGDGQNKPAEQIAEVVGDDPKQQADLIGPESMTGQPDPVSGFLALLAPVLRRPPLIVEADNRGFKSRRPAIKSRGRGEWSTVNRLRSPLSLRCSVCHMDHGSGALKRRMPRLHLGFRFLDPKEK